MLNWAVQHDHVDVINGLLVNHEREDGLSKKDVSLKYVAYEITLSFFFFLIDIEMQMVNVLNTAVASGSVRALGQCMRSCPAIFDYWLHFQYGKVWYYSCMVALR